MKQLRCKIFSLLCLVSLLASFQVPAYAEQQPEHHLLNNEIKASDTPSEDQLSSSKQSGRSTTAIVDFAYLYWYGLVAVVKRDGSVVAVKVEEAADHSAEECQKAKEVVEAWTNIIQIDSCQDTVIALKQDGTAVCLGGDGLAQRVSRWSQIKEVFAAMDGCVVGLRNDGSLEVAATDFFMSERDDFNTELPGWTDLKELKVHTADGTYVTGLKTNGTLIRGFPGFGYPVSDEGWTGENKNIIEYDSVGWKRLGLKADGTVIAGGYNNEQAEQYASWTNVKQVCAAANIGLKVDGTIVSNDDFYSFAQTKDWKGIKQLFHNEYDTYDYTPWTDEVIGLKADGTLEVTGFFYYDGLEEELRQWDNIVRVKILAGYVVGWKADGSVVTAGFSLPE